MSEFWRGVLAFPITCAILYVVIATIARQSRAVFQWYLGIKLTRWWAMAMVVFGLKHLHAKSFKIMRLNGRIWISPNNRFFLDKPDEA